MEEFCSVEPSEKKCRGCFRVLPLHSFNKGKNNPDGLQYICKECRHERHLIDWEKNSEKRKAASLRYRSTRAEDARKACREWHARNRERVMERQRKNRVKNRAKRAAYARKLRMENPKVKLAENLRRRIRDALKLGYYSGRTRELLGCSLEALQLHLGRRFLPGMSWANYGPVWHVDHVRPIASFDLNDPDQVAECFHFTNLQPLFAGDNVRKSATFTDPLTGTTKYFRKTGNQYSVAGNAVVLRPADDCA